jgi:predicted flap endonuclease-1-like 5' DNA nuclease
MTFELTATPEALLAERDRLDALLQTSEDWRALVQLQARSTRGEMLSAVDANGLVETLRAALAENPFYQRRCAVVAELTRRSTLSDAELTGAAENAGTAAQAPDDLTRIHGIDANLALRLRGLGVSTFEHIVHWMAADVRLVSATLGLGRRISAENWIEQAALLARENPGRFIARTAPAAAASSPKVSTSPATTATASAPPPIAGFDHPAFGAPPLPLRPLAYALAEAEHPQAKVPNPIYEPAPTSSVTAPGADAAASASGTARQTLAIQPLVALQAVEDAAEALIASAEIAALPKPSPSIPARASARPQAEPQIGFTSPDIAPHRRLTLRLGIEEASVEIVRRQAPEPPPLPAKALLIAHGGASQNQKVHHAPGPIGRFLKSLTGN